MNPTVITVFTFISAKLDAVLLPAVQTQIAQVLQAAAPAATVAVTIWLAGMCWLEITDGRSGNPLFRILRLVLRGALIVAMLNSTNYNAIFVNFFLNQLPADAVSAGGGQFGPALFDKALGSIWAGFLVVYNAASWRDPLSLAALVFVGIIAICEVIPLAIAYTLYFAVHAVLGLALIIGPGAVLCLLWEGSRFLFDGWLKACLAMVLTQVVLVTMLGLLIGVVQVMIDQMVTASNASDIPGMAGTAICGLVLFILLCYLSVKIERLAETIVGAAGAGISRLSSSLWGAAGKTVQAGASAVSGVAGAAARTAGKSADAIMAMSGSAGMRNTKPAGRAS